MPSKVNRSHSETQQAKLRVFADSVGDFIRYWGFRRIHGRIWAEVYLSKKPLSGVELTKILDVSKALASLALNELIEYDLISCINPQDKTKRYRANDDVYGVIKKILIKREQVLIKKSQKHFDALEKTLSHVKPEESLIDQDRLKVLGEMISSAVLAIDFVLETSSEESISEWSSKLKI